MPLADLLKREIQRRGPLTVAAFMDLALYHPDLGYYARAVQRSGRAGDFFTSVDVGPLFGELLAVQIAEMAGLLGGSEFHLAEAGAGNGRLAADILGAIERDRPALYQATRLHLIEASAAARNAQRDTLGPLAERLAPASATLPASFEGVIVANELLDAMPVHQVVMRDSGLHEIYVDDLNGHFALIEGPLSTPRLSAYFDDLGIQLEPGWTAEVALSAVDWVRDALSRMTRGFAVFIDYGHDARELYSVTHSAGTLTSYSRHRSTGPESAAVPDWLREPGEQDLTAHVDFTSAQRAAAAAGATTLGFLDQMYFLMALGTERFATLDLKGRLALKTLLMPGGLGTTMKVLIFGKGVGTPALTGCSGHARVT